MILLKYCKNGYKGISGKFWIVEDTKCKCTNICWSFRDAIRFFLWHLGVAPKIVFRKYNKKKSE